MLSVRRSGIAQGAHPWSAPSFAAVATPSEGIRQGRNALTESVVHPPSSASPVPDPYRAPTFLLLVRRGFLTRLRTIAHETARDVPRTASSRWRELTGRGGSATAALRGSFRSLVKSPRFPQPDAVTEQMRVHGTPWAAHFALVVS